VHQKTIVAREDITRKKENRGASGSFMLGHPFIRKNTSPEHECFL
jgi:hypothetical protein